MYIPGLASIDYSEDSSKLESQPEVLKLWVPSQLPIESRHAWCLPGVPDLEFRFRYAQADDTLAELRRHIRLLQLARDQNAKHTKSTSSTTRSQGILDGFRGKIRRLASQYRGACQALVALDPAQERAPDWGQYFHSLNDHDLRAPVRDEAQPSEGKTQYSWIWTSARPPPLSFPPTAAPHGVPQATAPAPASLPPALVVPTINSTDSDVVGQDFERVQWAKCQARAERYEEEVQLTVEEMGRTLRYFEWKRDWWLSLTPERTKSDAPPDIRHGLHAYAHRQSHLYDDLITSFILHWKLYLFAQSLGSSWLGRYTARVVPVPMQPSQRADAFPPATAVHTITLSNPPADPQLVDPPLRSESDNDSDWGNDSNTGGDLDDTINAEDVLDDD